MSVDKDILDAFQKSGSVKATSEATRYSWNRVVKSLSSSGIIINDTHKMILDMHDAGMTPQEISKQLSISVNTVQSYLPRSRPVYGENLSDNAKRIRNYRSRKMH